MLAKLHYQDQEVTVNFSKPIDISIPLSSEKNPRAWYLHSPEIEPEQSDTFIGSVAKGGSVNFNTIKFNPHAHGTHTEGVGHITSEVFSINKQLNTFFFFAKVMTVRPDSQENDQIITEAHFESFFQDTITEALVIRTLPNPIAKKHKEWSHTNWPYLDASLMARFCEKGVKHILIDLPSVDRERDDGKLLAHRAFWNTSGKTRMDATITEMIYVPDTVPDGLYLLNLQIAPFENDATPSKPILYTLNEL